MNQKQKAERIAKATEDLIKTIRHRTSMKPLRPIMDQKTGKPARDKKTGKIMKRREPLSYDDRLAILANVCEDHGVPEALMLKITRLDKDRIDIYGPVI